MMWQEYGDCYHTNNILESGKATAVHIELRTSWLLLAM
jgi:hypothetical protein